MEQLRLRFQERTAKPVEAYSASIGFDRRLALPDLQGFVAENGACLL